MRSCGRSAWRGGGGLASARGAWADAVSETLASAAERPPAPPPVRSALCWSAWGGLHVREGHDPAAFHALGEPRGAGDIGVHGGFRVRVLPEQNPPAPSKKTLPEPETRLSAGRGDGCRSGLKGTLYSSCGNCNSVGGFCSRRRAFREVEENDCVPQNCPSLNSPSPGSERLQRPGPHGHIRHRPLTAQLFPAASWEHPTLWPRPPPSPRPPPRSTRSFLLAQPQEPRCSICPRSWSQLNRHPPPLSPRERCLHRGRAVLGSACRPGTW